MPLGFHGEAHECVLSFASWLIYSRKATSSEQRVIDVGIAKITSKNPDAPGDLPFVSGLDLEDVEDIEEDLPDLPVIDRPSATFSSGQVMSQLSVNSAKRAFTAPASPAVNELEDVDPPTVEDSVVPFGSRQSSQSDKAKHAFIKSDKGTSSSAPPAVVRREDDEEDGVPPAATLPEKPLPATLPEEKALPDVKGPLSVRLRVNKRPKSPSPQKTSKAKKGVAKVKPDKARLAVVKEAVVEKKAKVMPKPKGKKKS
ncbi:uncharacterized protein MELLADRAFT_107314 [Melampsora larici-populina 98AG31]|uniref:Uncharacterized protein n=1 Tax=Melampsora larici-populina (strain 98AG31 / pathotype 3-4-7) TaxID=747676 RepID=F4RNX6_MELLP|nr:uncharacterized protein MELLADRAFT_107314 [Melampsora larici-populina 98AG31]EGG05826.1 hypothetical protein MELLADRAFT_107314 [Melampsora larici-populina 98AG31]